MLAIVVNSQKGGSGKTTITVNLAAEAERAGHGPVWMVDMDPQGTLTRCHEARSAAVPLRADVLPEGLEATLAGIKSRGAAHVFIDTAPTRDESIEAIVRCADLVLVPVRPGSADLWAVGETVAMLKEQGRRFLFVVNQAKSNARIVTQTAAALSHFGPIAETMLGDRVAYAAAFSGGRVVAELPDSKAAAEEVRNLWTDVRKMLKLRKEA